MTTADLLDHTDILFDVGPYVVEPIPAPQVDRPSADARRTLRQAQAIRGGVHPLNLNPNLPIIAMHPDADRAAAAGDPRNLPLRCGTCRFRTVLGYHSRSYAKCLFGLENHTDQQKVAPMPPRVTHGAGSDVRAWWPGCVDYSPSDPISGDAARWIPEVAAR